MATRIGAEFAATRPSKDFFTSFAGCFQEGGGPPAPRAVAIRHYSRYALASCSDRCRHRAVLFIGSVAVRSIAAQPLRTPPHVDALVSTPRTAWTTRAVSS
jgi:hypothetical protein